MKIKFLLVGLSGLLLTGCVAGYHYRPYIGEQQDWPMAKGSFMETNGVLPIYYGYPSKPYDVIGMITTDVRCLQMANRNAKYQGGEALVLKSSQTFQGGSVTFPGASTTTVNGNFNAYNSGNYNYGNFSGNSQTYSSPSVSVPIMRTYQSFMVIKFKTEPATPASSATNQPANNSKSTLENP